MEVQKIQGSNSAVNITLTNSNPNLNNLKRQSTSIWQTSTSVGNLLWNSLSIHWSQSCFAPLSSHHQMHGICNSELSHLMCINQDHDFVCQCSLENGHFCSSQLEFAGSQNTFIHQSAFGNCSLTSAEKSQMALQ